MLTDKQGKEFVEFYRSLYGENNNEIPELDEGLEEEHKKLRKERIKKILWREYYSTLLNKRNDKRTYGERVFEGLWFNYWPKIIRKKERP